MEQFTKFFKNLNSSQRAVILGGFSVLFIFLLFLLAYTNFKSMQGKHSYTIAANLTKSQVMLASSELEASNIPFSIIGTGNSLTLKTNKENINLARIKLVTSQASTDKHIGWEIFEKSSLGTTNFENKIKYLRALEGELARSIESLSNVLSASVKVAIPKESLFTKTKKQPTASAILSLKPGMSLTQNQINGVKNFIASAVPSLSPENIKLINQDGTLLEEDDKQKQDQLISQQENYRKQLEKDYEQKVIDLLEPIIGKGRVVAKISIQLDFTKKAIQQEIFDPEGTIRSQQTEETTTQSQSKEAYTLLYKQATNGNLLHPKSGSTNKWVNAKSSYALAMMYYYGIKPVKQNRQKAFDILKQLYLDLEKANKNLQFTSYELKTQIEYRLGLLLLEGRGTSKDSKKAFEFLHQAAQHHHYKAAKILFELTQDLTYKRWMNTSYEKDFWIRFEKEYNHPKDYVFKTLFVRRMYTYNGDGFWYLNLKRYLKIPTHNIYIHLNKSEG